jgi:hypothetical protein
VCHEAWSICSSLANDSGFLGYYDVSLGEYFLLLWRTIVLLSSSNPRRGTLLGLLGTEDEGTGSFQVSGTVYPRTECNILHELNIDICRFRATWHSILSGCGCNRYQFCHSSIPGAWTPGCSHLYKVQRWLLTVCYLYTKAWLKIKPLGGQEHTWLSWCYVVTNNSGSQKLQEYVLDMSEQMCHKSVLTHKCVISGESTY